MKKLLILGGSGFVGNSIVDCAINKKLIKHNINEIYIVSRNKNSKKKKYKHIKINYICKNIVDIKKIPQVDYVIYCIKSRSIKSSNNYFNNFSKLLNNLPKKPKILFTSSGVVYGKNDTKKKDRENKNINIKSINKLSGYKIDYAKEKLSIEKKIKELGYENYKVSIARCYTFIGKNILRYKYAISDLINDACDKSKITLKTNLNVYRSYMHSDDLVNWLIVILKKSNNSCPIYNVGSDKSINLNTLSKKIAKLTKKKLSLKISKNKKFDYYVPSIYKAKKKLNLKISINLNDALNLMF